MQLHESVETGYDTQIRGNTINSILLKKNSYQSEDLSFGAN